MSNPSTKVYALDRNGFLYILDPTTLANQTASGYNSPYSLNQATGIPGAANGGIALDNTLFNVFLPGMYGNATVPPNVLMAVFSALPASLNQPSGTPVAMPAGSFRPISAVYDGSARVYAADYAGFLTAWITTAGGTQFTSPAGFPLTPGAGNIKAQGLCYDNFGTSPLLFTCCQNSFNQDELMVIGNLSTSSPSTTPYALSSILLPASYTGIASDANNIYITSNNPAGVLTVVNRSTYVGTVVPTSGLDSRGICTGGGYIFVCNFGSNSLSVYHSTTSGPMAISGSPFTAGPSPIAVAYLSTGASTGTVYVANFNGVGGPITAYTFNYASTPTMTPVTISSASQLPGVQFSNLVVG